MASPKPADPALAPLPRPADVAARREDAVRGILAGAANRLLYVSAYAGGLVTLREADGTVIDEPIAWVGHLPPQVGDAAIRLAVAGRGGRDAAPSSVALGPIHKADDGPGIVEREGSATNGATPANASTSTYVIEQTVLIPLGPGTWEVVATGDLLLTHTASGQADVQVVIDGVATSRQSPALSTAVYTSVAGTVQARNPVLRARATRLAP
jgi:hypothetical protein